MSALDGLSGAGSDTLKSSGNSFKILILGPTARDSYFMGTGHGLDTGNFSKLPVRSEGAAKIENQGAAAAEVVLPTAYPEQSPGPAVHLLPRKYLWDE